MLKSIYSRQIVELLKQLADLETWSRDSVIDSVAFANALGGESEIVPAHQKGHLRPELPKMVACDQELPTVPTQVALSNPGIDRDEVLTELCEWVAAGRRARRLHFEAAK